MSTPVAFKVIPKHLAQPFKLPHVCSRLPHEFTLLFLINNKDVGFLLLFGFVSVAGKKCFCGNICATTAGV